MNSPAKPLSIATRRAKHLTDEQLDELMIGGDTTVHLREHRAHLAACTECTARLSATSTQLAAFSDLSMAWAQRRSATLPVRLPRVSVPYAARVAAATALCAALIAGVTNPSLQYLARSHADAFAGTTAEDASSYAQDDLTRDNRMLYTVARESDADADATADLPATLGLRNTDTATPPAPTAPSRESM